MVKLFSFPKNHKKHHGKIKKHPEEPHGDELPPPDDGDLNFDIFPALPASVAMNSLTGVISGSPLVEQTAGCQYTVTVRWRTTGEVATRCAVAFAVVPADLASACNAAYLGHQPVEFRPAPARPAQGSLFSNAADDTDGFGDPFAALDGGVSALTGDSRSAPSDGSPGKRGSVIVAMGSVGHAPGSESAVGTLPRVADALPASSVWLGEADMGYQRSLPMTGQHSSGMPLEVQTTLAHLSHTEVASHVSSSERFHNGMSSSAHGGRSHMSSTEKFGGRSHMSSTDQLSLGRCPSWRSHMSSTDKLSLGGRPMTQPGHSRTSVYPLGPPLKNREGDGPAVKGGLFAYKVPPLSARAPRSKPLY